MHESFDAIIVGAGIVGTACACELARAGLTVALIEQDTVGSGATATGMGHIVVMDDSPAQLALTRYSQTLWDALVADAPEQHEYSRCGTLWIATDDEEMQAVRAKQRLYREYQIASELLDAHQIYDLEPELRAGLAGGLLVPGDSVVYPPKSAALLLKQAQQERTTLIAGSVTRLQSGAVQLHDGRMLHGGAIIVASGIRSRDLLPDLPLCYKKGHLVITDRYPDFIRHQLVEVGYVKNAHATSGDSVSFNVQPRSTGQILIGSSRQLDDATRSIDFALLSKMLARASDFLPRITQLSCIRTWTGFRAATDDGLPLIGPYAQEEGIWVATGHEGLGITTAPATAHLLAAQMLGQASAIPWEPYLPQRTMQKEEHV
ncbi:MAG TPA: FAD-dependent oxidoreductase [Ktedonobacteraceae bacterium]|nr:FAD-dependent oxidoreductase [Ktedonobacteraceae bacterium]